MWCLRSDALPSVDTSPPSFRAGWTPGDVLAILPRALATVLILAATSVGCTWATYNSIHRDWRLGDQAGRADAIDAKQRVILSKQFKAEPGAEGGGGAVPPVVTCAEPSPDALQVLSMALAAEVTEPQSGVTGRLAGSSSEGALSIGLRTQTIQLLRDGMYRLCESYFNRAMNGPSFKAAHLRYQDAMVALLAIEQLTGAVRPQFGSIGSQGNATVNVGAPKEGGGEGGAAAPAANVNVSTSTTGSTQATPTIDPDVSKEVAEAVEGIVEAMLNKDYSLQFCIDYLSSSAARDDRSNNQVAVINWCTAVLDRETTSQSGARGLDLRR